MIELEAEQWLDYGGEPRACYPKAAADAVIVELKARLARAIAERDGNQVCIDVLKAKLEDVNELIKTARQMLEDAKATHYAEMVDAGMRERKLKRALWLARAERYKMCEFIAREEGNLSNQMSWSRILRERTYNQWVDQLLRIANLANKLQTKCRAKAEEYK